MSHSNGGMQRERVVQIVQHAVNQSPLAREKLRVQALNPGTLLQLLTALRIYL